MPHLHIAIGHTEDSHATVLMSVRATPNVMFSVFSLSGLVHASFSYQASRIQH